MDLLTGLADSRAAQRRAAAGRLYAALSRAARSEPPLPDDVADVSAAVELLGLADVPGLVASVRRAELSAAAEACLSGLQAALDDSRRLGRESVAAAEAELRRAQAHFVEVCGAADAEAGDARTKLPEALRVADAGRADRARWASL
ncbi:MAG: hypothetical protein AB1716_24380, partial [Planctomycetota bacterium]